MLYDSPTAGLDPIYRLRIIALVIQQRDTRNATSIVVTHRIQDGYLLENYAYYPQTRRIARVVGAWTLCPLLCPPRRQDGVPGFRKRTSVLEGSLRVPIRRQTAFNAWH